jgi:hypothetical protein
MSELVRRGAAVAVTAALVALVACDVWIGGVRTWWDRHSLTGSVVSSLLVVAVTALVIDEVVARRQRRERSVSVAVQGLIVYGQARRAYDAITTGGTEESHSATGAPEELRTLASMLLTASPSLFDDPVARRFLEQLERFSASMFGTASARSRGVPGADDRARLASEMSRLQATVKPLLARIPSEDRSLLEGPPRA